MLNGQPAEFKMDMGANVTVFQPIILKEDAKPFQVTVPRKVPLPLYQKTKEELDRNRHHIQNGPTY